MSEAKNPIFWDDNGFGHGRGKKIHAGKTLDRRINSRLVLRTTYGYNVLDTGMVATVCERIPMEIVKPKTDYIDKMLNQAAWENGY